jgi:hypothetical protein
MQAPYAGLQVYAAVGVDRPLEGEYRRYIALALTESIAAKVASGLLRFKSAEYRMWL